MDKGEIGKFPVNDTLETPFMHARAIWDDRIGSARVQAYSWRLVAFFSLLMTALMGCALIWRSTTASVIPYIVEVDKQGSVLLVGSPKTQTWEPGEGVQRYFLREWLSGVRSVPGDPAVLRESWLRVYAGATAQAQGLLDEQVHEENPFTLREKFTRKVEITAMVKVSAASWRVEWTEKTFDRQGQAASPRNTMMGLFELRRVAPTTRAEIEANPLGLFVEHFSLSKIGGAK